jgi:hypothetical protein
MVDAASGPRAADEAFTDRVTVRFEGPGSGSGPLSWGQSEIWNTIRRTGSSFPIGGAVPVARGRTIEDLAGELRFFLSRYESLRTLLRLPADGEPIQLLADRGEAVLGIVDAPDGDEPALTARRLAEQWRNTRFDYEHEWPIRMAAVRHRGVPTHVVVIISHIATDGAGVAIMVRELGERDPATGLAKSPATAPGPLELARRQRGPAALAHNEAALRYWGRLLRQAAPDRCAPPRDRGEPRYLLATFESPALYLALRALAPGNVGPTAPVLLAAYAMATCRVTGVSPSLIQIIVNNRFRAELAELTHPLCHNGLLLADVAQVDFPQAVERMRRACMLSMKHGYYDPVDLRRLRAEISAERGREVDLGILFNDQRTAGEARDAGPTPTPQEVRAALARRSLRWQPLPLFVEKLMLFVREVPGGAVQLSAEADTRHVSAQDVEAILLGIESIVVEAACGDELARSRRTAADTYA